MLAKHWPEAKRYDDVRSATALAPVDVICGGFPCQPFSVAGKRLADKDERHLWPEYARIIDEVGPKIVIAENVPGLRTSGLRGVLADLAALGFDVEWACYSALDAGAPHLRKRLFVVATHPERCGLRLEQGWLGRSLEGSRAPVAGRALEILRDAYAYEQHGRRELRKRESQALSHAQVGRPTDADRLRRLQSALGFARERGWAEYCGWDFDLDSPVDDGRPSRLVRRGRAAQRKALGNAVVIACAEAVGRALVSALDLTGGAR